MSSALPDPVLLAYVTAGLAAAFVLNEARHAALARWRRHKTPVPGNAASPIAAAPHTPLRQPPALGPHGAHVATVDIWEDGYTKTAYHLSGHTEIHRGECAECAQGTCSWCGFWPRYDPVRGREVHQYQKCPAHQDKAVPR